MRRSLIRTTTEDMNEVDASSLRPNKMSVNVVPRKVHMIFYMVFGIVVSSMVFHQVKLCCLSYFHNNTTGTTSPDPCGVMMMMHENMNNFQVTDSHDGIIVLNESGANNQNNSSNDNEHGTDSGAIDFIDSAANVIGWGLKSGRAAVAAGGFDGLLKEFEARFVQPIKELYNYMINLCIWYLQVFAVGIVAIMVATVLCQKCRRQSPTSTATRDPAPLRTALLPPVPMTSLYNAQREPNAKKVSTWTTVPYKAPNKVSIQTKNDVVQPVTWSLRCLFPMKKEPPFWEREYNLNNYIELLDCLRACNKYFVRNGCPSRGAAAGGTTHGIHGYNTMMYERLTMNELQFIARGLRMIGISPASNKATLIDAVIMAYAKLLVTFTMPTIKEILLVKAKRPASNAKKQDLVKLSVEAAF